MSGMDVVAIIGTVAAVVSAFEHGEALLKKIKENRAERKAVLPPPTLEQSLIRGPRAVSDAYESGVETYGKAFQVENDRKCRPLSAIMKPTLISVSGIALDAFKDIIIILQGTLLRHLVTAQEDDTISDFGLVLNASNMGRVRSVHVLNEMYMRMAQAAPVNGWMGQQGGQQQQVLEAPRQQQMLPSHQGFVQSPVLDFNWNGQPQRTMTEATSSTFNAPGRSMTGATTASLQSQPRYIPGVTSHPHTPFQPRPTATTIEDQEQQYDLAKSSTSTKSGLRSLFSSPKPRTVPSPQEDSGRYSVSSDGKSLSSSSASFISGASPDISMSSTGSRPQHSRLDSNGDKIPFHASPHAEHRKRLNNKPKPKRAVTTSSNTTSIRAPLTPSKSSIRKFSFPIGGSKAPKPDYAGWCEGAYLMQTGNHGMKLRNQSVSMTGQNQYWACANSRCCFEGGAIQTRDENKKTIWGFDDSIREAYGVRYRWTFLAKSHRAIGTSKAGFEYQCAFCAALGAACSKLKGENEFLQHVATHQGEKVDRFKMFLFNYVVGRRALVQESFDVNLDAPTLEADHGIYEKEALECYEKDVHEVYEKEASYIYEKEANNTGLGIKMGGQGQRPDEEVFDRDDVRTTTVRSMNVDGMTKEDGDLVWQNNASLDHFLGDSNQNERNAFIDGWGPPIREPTRDSTYSLHPAPLFSKSAPPAAAIHDQGEESEQPDGPEQDHDNPQEEEEVDEEVDTYNNTAYDVHPAFRSRISVPNPWRTSYATLDSRKGSLSTQIGGMGINNRDKPLPEIARMKE